MNLRNPLVYTHCNGDSLLRVDSTDKMYDKLKSWIEENLDLILFYNERTITEYICLEGYDEIANVKEIMVIVPQELRDRLVFTINRGKS